MTRSANTKEGTNGHKWKKTKLGSYIPVGFGKTVKLNSLQN